MAAAVLFLVAARAHGASEAPAAGLELIPENTQLWRETDLWDEDISLRAGLGYKDNVLLGPPAGTILLASGSRASAPRGSAFFTTGPDLLLFRLPFDGLEFNLAVTGDDVRYWRDVGVNHEDVFAASAEVKKYLGSGWQLGLEFRESYIDQIQYVILQSGPASAQVKGNLLKALPSLRRNLGTNWWTQLSGEITRAYFAAPLDDSWQFGPRASLGRTYGVGSSVSLSYGIFHESHDSLPATDFAGNSLPGTKRAFWKHDVELRWEQVWDARKHFRSVARLGFHDEQDNGAGFFNYHGYSVSAELRYQDRNWQFKCAGRVSYQDYYKQRTVPDILASPTLNRTPLDLSLRAERRVYKSLRVYAQYEYDQTSSNLASDEYQANTVTGGLSYAF